MESKKWLALVLVIVALLASLEYMPRNILLRVAIPSDASYPLNKGPYGTSKLWNMLASKGYREAIVYGYSGLPRLRNVKDVVILEIGGSSTAPPSEAYRLARDLVARNVRVHLIVLDEEPSQGVSKYIENVSDLLCGYTPPRIRGPLNSTYNDLYLVVDGKAYDLPTGYTGYLSYTTDPVATPGKPRLPENQGLYKLIAAAWPYPSPPYNGFWYIIGAECRSNRGSVVLIADSTIATNMEADAHPEAVEAITNIINDRVSSPRTTLILVDEEFYVNPGQGNVQLILSLHPSIFLLAFAKAYSGIEKFVIKDLVGHHLTPLLVLGIATVLSAATLYASRITGKEKVRVKTGRKRSWKLGITLSLGLGSWSDAYTVCMRAEKYSRLITGHDTSLGTIRELTQEVGELCRRVRGSRVLRYIPLWGSLKRRIIVNTALALSIEGVYPYQEALKLLEGEGRGQQR
ncbi:MAG: hypothetical protein F7C33_05830 [Desulfurococcales archaeon]|nr:hypothetical protein [Desulfurococcales archaeon]